VKIGTMIAAALEPWVKVWSDAAGKYARVSIGDFSGLWSSRDVTALELSIGAVSCESHIGRRRADEAQICIRKDGRCVRASNGPAAIALEWGPVFGPHRSSISLQTATVSEHMWAPPVLEKRVGDLLFRVVSGAAQDAGYEAYKAKRKAEAQPAAEMPS
jgi:hypothetical protein